MSKAAVQLVALPQSAFKAKKILKEDVKWCYLGKDITKRTRLARLLGEEKRFYLKDRLHKVSKELRDPYINFVADMGRKEENALNWWASKFASKCHIQTDFFLLVCYKALLLKIIEEESLKEKLTVFIEDPWLFADIKNIYKNQGISFLGHPNIFAEKCVFTLRGIAHRILLVGWLVLAKLLMRTYHKGKKPPAVNDKGHAVAIINPAEPRAFRNQKYFENYMPGLSELYKENSIPFFFIYLLRFPLLTSKSVGLNRKILWPLAIDIKFSDVLKRLCVFWNPRKDNTSSMAIRKYGVSMLLEREKALEFSSTGLNFHLILYDSLNNFFAKKWCRSVVYVFENQPWEKMLCMAARKNNIKAIGYQHSSISSLFVSQFIGKGESSFAPLPDHIFTTGTQPANLYKEGGMPNDKIVVAGAWRYKHMIDEVIRDTHAKKGISSKPIALICLPLRVSVSMAMMEYLDKAISNNKLNKEADFWVKTHPGNTKYELDLLKNMVSKYTVVTRSFRALLSEVDIVISFESTSAMEAFLCGKKIIPYVPENFLPADSSVDIKDRNVYIWYEGGDLSPDFLKNFASIQEPQEPKQGQEEYFSEINSRAWIECVKS